MFDWVNKIDDWAAAAWENPVVRAVSKVLLVTVVADFLAAKGLPASLAYVQHLVAQVWPIVDAALKTL